MELKQKQPVQIFNKLLQKFESINHKDILEKADTVYAVRQFKIGLLTPEMVSQIYQNVSYKFNRNYNPNAQLNWWQNQLRIFVWTLVLYVELKETKIEELTSDDWEYFSKIFPNKKLILFEYQSINILKQHGQAKKWILEQDQQFSRLVNEKGLKCKWSQLAKLLYIQSERLYFRTPKQCRQRWLNHLDPSKSKTEWEPKQDYILIRYAHEKGKKWAQISKLLSNKRNEHSIKNRFKSLITKQQKFHKQKLEEIQLIAYIYKRYVNHFKFSNHGENQNSKNSQKIFQEDQQNIEEQQQFKKAKVNKVMYPFTYISKTKQSNSFLPYRKSDSTGSPIIKLQNHHRSLYQNNVEGKSFEKLTPTRLEPGFSKLPQHNYFSRSFEEPSQHFDRLFCSNNYLPAPEFESHNNLDEFTKNEDEYFPTFDSRINQESNQYVQNLASEHISQANQIINQKEHEADEKEKQIRADLFVIDDPFELLKPYFIKSRSNISEQTPNIFRSECKFED